MIFRRILLALIAAAIFATAAAVDVVGLAFALYALVEPRWGRAGAAATVALAAAALVTVAGLMTAWAGRRKPSKAPATLGAGLVDRVFAFFRQKPVVAASAAIGAGIMAVRNPKYLGAVLRAFVEGASPPK